jgi:dolichol kinase
MLAVILGIAVAGLPLLAIEFFTRTTHRTSELTRKATHVSSSLAVVLLTTFCSLTQIAIIAGLFFVFLSLVRPQRIWKSLYAVQRKSWGEVLFPLGVLATALWSTNERTFIAVVLILGVSDTLATIVGQRMPRKPLPAVTQKTYAGSTAFLVSAFCLLALLFQPHISFGVAVCAVVMTLVEAISRRGLDNLSVPVVGVVMLRIFNL